MDRTRRSTSRRSSDRRSSCSVAGIIMAKLTLKPLVGVPLRQRGSMRTPCRNEAGHRGTVSAAGIRRHPPHRGHAPRGQN